MEQGAKTPSADMAADKIAKELTDTMLGANKASGGAASANGKRPKPIFKPNAQEPEYSAEEFAGNPALFGVGADIITAALSYNGVARCTLAEAKGHVRKYAERQVR
jgi:hypothetical protein